MVLVKIGVPVDQPSSKPVHYPGLQSQQRYLDRKPCVRIPPKLGLQCGTLDKVVEGPGGEASDMGRVDVNSRAAKNGDRALLGIRPAG